MTASDGHTTSLTLLVRLKTDPTDPATWDEFVGRYSPMILRWCRNWGLQAADAQDVSQNVLLALSQQMTRFEYRADGRFRSWLKTVAYRAWCRFHEKQRQNEVCGDNQAIAQLLESVEAREDFLSELDRECERNVLEDAMEMVRQRVQPHTWEAFHRTALQCQSAAEVAKNLEMTVVAVYRSRSRVQSMIQEEVRMLEGADEPVERLD